MTYRSPRPRTCSSWMKELAGIDELTRLPAFEGRRLRHRAGRARGVREVQRGRGRAVGRRRATATSYFQDGDVIATPGFKEAFKQFGDGGWQGLQHPTDFGGQGLPKLIGAACGEMINSANVSFALCPLLTDGAIEALLTAGSDAQKQTFLPNMLGGGRAR